MRRARLKNFQAFIGCSTVIAALATSVACEPDLDSLSAQHGLGAKGGSGSGGTSGNSSGGTSSEGGDGSQPDSCFDDKRSADESDVDCGGTGKCRRCDLNAVCTANTDCAVGFCRSNRCTEPTCDDRVRNQDETDVDCGGSCVPEKRCSLDEGCKENKDCQSGFCDENVCKSHCLSGKKDGDETGKDCGGPTCGECPTGEGCKDNSDCDSDLCLNDSCADPSCDDNLKNGDETGKDCGGSCASSTRCALGEACLVANDCDSYVCEDEECVEDEPFEEGDVVDLMEDGNLTISVMGGGAWYTFGDDAEGASNNIANELIPGKRGSASKRAIHNTGDGHNIWGSGVGFDLVGATSNDPKPGAKGIFDASAYRGISFWARSDTSSTLKVIFPDSATERSRNDCTVTDNLCDKHLIASVGLEPEWKKFQVLFSGLVNEQGASHTELIKGELVSMQFRPASNGPPYDYWIDDIVFLPELPE